MNVNDKHPIRYSIYSIEDPGMDDLLKRATNDVQTYSDVSDFEATWVLVVTWDQAEIVDSKV